VYRAYEKAHKPGDKVKFRGSLAFSMNRDKIYLEDAKPVE
jgi:hypothetical protein